MGGPPPGTAGVGAVLREQRERLGLSLEEVAAATRIPRAHLEALEADRPEDLPAGPYAAGYLRTLRDHLGLHDLTPPPAPAASAPSRSEPVDVGGGGALDVVRALALVSVFALFALLASALARRAAMVESLPEAGPATTQTLRLLVDRDTHLGVVIDGETALEGPVEHGEELTFEASLSIEVELAAVDDVRVFWNGVAVQPQGQQKAPRKLMFVDDVSEPALSGGR